MLPPPAAGGHNEVLQAPRFLHETKRSMNAIDPDELLLAYRLGVFPMAENRNAPDVLWVRPKTRCILPLNDFHVPKRLARTIRNDRFDRFGIVDNTVDKG